MKNITFKIFVWVIEFKLKKKGNKGKILYLVSKLINEIKSQGYDMDGRGTEKHIFFSIFEHDDCYQLNGQGLDVSLNKGETK